MAPGWTRWTWSPGSRPGHVHLHVWHSGQRLGGVASELPRGEDGLQHVCPSPGRGHLLFLLCMASLVSLETSPLANTQLLARELPHRVKYFTYIAGLSLLTAMAVGRQPAALPVRSLPRLVQDAPAWRLAAGVCAGLWALSLVMNTLGLVFCRWSWRSDKKHCFTVDSVLISLILGLFTPVMAVFSLTLFVRVRRSSLCGRRQPMRLYVVILAPCWCTSPACCPSASTGSSCPAWTCSPRCSPRCICLARLLSSVSSSTNPVIYFLLGTRRGRGLPESLGATPELEGKETPSSYTNEVGG